MQYKINQIIHLLKKEFTGLDPKPSKSDPLDVLIATMLSQNTTDKTSYIAFQNLQQNIGNWETVMKAPLARIKSEIKVCGLANQKAISIVITFTYNSSYLLKNIYSRFGILSLNHIKKMSDEQIYDELLQYKGIGVKTVSCVLAFSLERDVFPVDTHVHRLSNRLGLARSNSPDKTFEQLKNKIPDGKKFLLHTLLIRFGRKICKANNPLCGRCILYELCEFKDKEQYAMNDNKPAKENNFIILENI